MNANHFTGAALDIVGANPILERLFFASLELAGLALLVALAIGCFRIRSARAISILWLVVLTKPILTLAFGPPLPLLQVAPAPAAREGIVSAEVSTAGLRVYLDPAPRIMPQADAPSFPAVSAPRETPAAPARTATSPAPAPEASQPPLDWRAMLPAALLTLWIAGVLLFACRALVDRVRLRRFIAQTADAPESAVAALQQTAAELGVRAVPPLRVTTALESPAIVGWLRPAIVTPAWLAEPENEAALLWALRHELTHLKHRDPGANALRNLSQILFFFHPVTWFASRRWESAVELACDRAVVKTDHDVTAYAEQLYAILVQARQQRRHAMASGLFATRTQINTRIAALLGTSLRTPARLGVAAATALALFAGLAFSVGGAFVQGASEDNEKDTAASELPARVLSFPADTSIGTVWIGDPHAYDYTPDNEPDMTEGGGWVNLGEARGDIEIPAGKAVWLDVGPKRQAVDLSPLAKLPPNGVQYLDLYRTWTGDDDLRHIAGLTELEALSVYSTKVTDAGLAHLARLENLRWLDLGGSDITGTGFGSLAHMKKLVHLDLTYLKLNEKPDDPLRAAVDTVLKGAATPPIPGRRPVDEIARLTSLRWLDLRATGVTGADLKALAPLTELHTLNLESCPIANEDLEHLAPFQKLRHLVLKRTHIAEGYKTHLAALPEVVEIDLDYTAAPEAPHRMLAIGGQVVNEAGEPVSDVKVEFYGAYTESVVSSGDEDTTNTEGRWKLRIPDGWTRLAACLSHPEYISDRVFGIRPIPPKEQLLDNTATFVLKKGTNFSGTVRDAQGTPVAGAFVLNNSFHGTLERMKQEPGFVQTDANGRFTVTNLEKRRHDELTILSSDHAPMVVPLDYNAPEIPLEVTVEPGVSIEGIVVDAAGNPLDGVTVSIDEWRPNRQHALPRETKTDAEGHFTLDHMPDHGTVTLYARNAGFNSASARQVLPLAEPLQLALVKDLPFRGKVVDAATGEPVSDFQIDIGTLSASGEYWWLSRYSDGEINGSTGAFKIEPNAIFDGTKEFGFVARVRAKGYRVAESKPLEAARLGEEVLFALKPAPEVAGQVRDADGRPVEGAQIAWVRADEHAFLSNGVVNPDFGGSPEWYESSDNEGRFSFAADVEPGVLVAYHEKGLAWLDLAGHAGPANLALQPWVRVEGTVHIAGGELTPVSAAVNAPVVAGRDDFFHFTSTSVNTDETGHFILENLPAMPMSVGVQRRWEPSHGVYLTPKPGDVLRVSIGDGKHAASGTFDLRAVSGLLHNGDAELTDSRHLVVRATPADSADAPEAIHYIPEIEADGRFLLAGIPAGEYVLSATAHATPPLNACGRGTPVGRAELRFTAGGEPGETALGTIALTPVSFPQQSQAAPPIGGTLLDSGESWSLAGEAGKLVVLDFWATWCAPCVAAMPALKDVYAKLPADRVSMVGLNLDVEASTAAHFAGDKALPWKQVYIGSWAEDNPVTAKYGVSFIPSIWIIGSDGTILARDVEPAALLETVEKFLATGGV